MTALLLNNREEESALLNSQRDSQGAEQPVDEEAARELLKRSLRRKYEVLALLSRAFA